MAGKREELHLDPANPFAYDLVVRAVRSGEPVSAELVLGPFWFFNNDTSTVRNARHAPRATRCVPHLSTALPAHTSSTLHRREPAIARLRRGGVLFELPRLPPRLPPRLSPRVPPRLPHHQPPA